MSKGACLELREKIGNIDSHYLAICALENGKNGEKHVVAVCGFEIFQSNFSFVSCIEYCYHCMIC